jgi:hypothetical protein
MVATSAAAECACSPSRPFPAWIHCRDAETYPHLLADQSPHTFAFGSSHLILFSIGRGCRLFEEESERASDLERSGEVDEAGCLVEVTHMEHG